MRVTHYEISSTLQKASVGAGLPVGLADDIGNAATWLACHDCGSVASVLAAIEAGMSIVRMHVNDEGILVFPNARVAICGPSVIDLLIGGEAYTEAHLFNADSALLVMGLAGVVAAQHDLEFQFSFSNGAKAQVTAGQLIKQGGVPSSGCDIVVTCQKADATGSKTSTPTSGVKVDSKTWREAERLAARTYVPQSQKSRTGGAGAGLNDND